MEIIIEQIKSVLENHLTQQGFSFDKKTKSYSTMLKGIKGNSYGYYFDIRKKIGGDYFLLNISMRILNKEISAIANSVKIKTLNERQNIPKSLKTSLLKEIKGNVTLTGIYDWREIDDAFKDDVRVWRCSIYDLTEIKNYDKQLLFLFSQGQKWIEKCNNWDFLIDWALKHNNALQALSILKYLNRIEAFESMKAIAIEMYEQNKYPTDELNNIKIS